MLIKFFNKLDKLLKAASFDKICNKYLATFTLVFSLSAIADDHINKDEIEKLVIMKDDRLFFHLENGQIYRGDPRNPIHCPAKVRGRITLKDRVNSELTILHNNGFTTCRFDLTRVA